MADGAENEKKYPIQLFNENGKIIFDQWNPNHWIKYEYDQFGNEIYYEDSDGNVEDNRNGQLNEGLNLQKKEWKYFDIKTGKEFPKDELDQHARWGKSIDNYDGRPAYTKFYNGAWFKYEYDGFGRCIHYQQSDGKWWKRKYNQKGDVIYYETQVAILINNNEQFDNNLNEEFKGKMDDLLGQVVATKASVAKAKLGATLDEGQSYTAIYAVLGGTAVLVTCMLTYSYFKN